MNTNHSVQSVQEPSLSSSHDFEAAVHFFPEELYEVLNSTHDYTSDSTRYIRSSPDPGFRYEIRKSKVNFWLECKYRENKQNTETITVFNPGQLDMYKIIENSFLFLSTNLNGEEMHYLIPFQHIPGDNLSFSFIEPYKLNYGLGVRPGMILQYLKLENTNPVIRF